MVSRPAAQPPHPIAERVDWDAVRDEAAQTLSAYVKLDSSHPVGRTVESAQLIADKLAAEGIPSKVYETPDRNKVNLVARLTAKNPVGKPLLISSHMDVVQAVAEDWTFDPYSGEIASGQAAGSPDRHPGARSLSKGRGAAPTGRRRHTAMPLGASLSSSS